MSDSQEPATNAPETVTSEDDLESVIEILAQDAAEDLDGCGRRVNIVTPAGERFTIWCSAETRYWYTVEDAQGNEIDSSESLDIRDLALRWNLPDNTTP